MLFLILLLFLTSCNISKDKEYYSKFKNPDLNYTWEFNKSLIEMSGKTVNSTYFELKKYALFQEIFQLKVPYEITYKHEEGHIYINQLLNIEDFDEFIENKFESSNTTNHASFRQYMISVSEGIADYYAINHFNNSRSKNYYEFIKKNRKDNIKGYKQHYQGLEYINASLKTKFYSNFTELILDLGSEKQYHNYLNIVT